MTIRLLAPLVLVRQTQTLLRPSTGIIRILGPIWVVRRSPII